MAFILKQNIVAVAKEEIILDLMPDDERMQIIKSGVEGMFFNNYNHLKVTLHRSMIRGYGPQRITSGGNGRQLLVNFDTLEKPLQKWLGDPRQVDHILARYHEISQECVDYYATFLRFDRHLSTKEQDRYIVNASVLEAVEKLEIDRKADRQLRSGSNRGIISDLHIDAQTFNDYLWKKIKMRHNLPTTLTHFRKIYNAFKRDRYYAVIKDPAGKARRNALKVDEDVYQVLTFMFADKDLKPSPTAVAEMYADFLKGNREVWDKETGELMNPKDYPTLTSSTILNWLRKWESEIATWNLRASNRQQYINKFIPSAQMELPQLAGDIISVDDRQPPFWYSKGQRMWFYLGCDVASECMTTIVWGKSKENLILEFYRQMVRNYTEWGLNLPYELECESSLNSAYTKDKFLAQGKMFGRVHMEANNARAKYIERVFGKMRYGKEKESLGWIGRPFAKDEANQARPGANIIIPYNRLVEARLKDIESWNNADHRSSTEDNKITRWEYFLHHQNPKLTTTNWSSILPTLGHKTKSSCNAAYVNLQGKRRALATAGKIATGQPLINILQQIEGKNVDIYWLDGNDGEVLHAIIYHNDRMVCELMEMPKFQRAHISRTTDADREAEELQMRYKNTVIAFGNEQLKSVRSISLESRDVTPAHEPEQKFTMPGLRQRTVKTIEDVDNEQQSPDELLNNWDDLNEDDQDILTNPSAPVKVRGYKDNFKLD